MDPDSDEARRVAAGTMHSFNNVLSCLTKQQQLIATKALLKHVRDLLEKLEKKING